MVDERGGPGDAGEWPRLYLSASPSKGTLKDRHDRFFPNQDTLPQGGFRNPIALRQQKPRRGDGSSVFLDDRGSIQLDVVSTTSSERRTRCPALNSP